MEYLTMIAGGITGWIVVEFIADFSWTRMPLPLNLALTFVVAG